MDERSFYVPIETKYVLKKLYKNNFSAYLVGGCIRDFLLNKNPKDFDIATSALPNDIKKIFYKTVSIGIKHGTIIVIVNKKNIEITTFRIDGNYKNFRKPDKVFFIDRLNQDLARRDFTINAMAYDFKNKKIIDLYDGKNDIKKKIIRCVGNANERFKEDALRMLRSLRFAMNLNFDIEKKTYRALKNNIELIKFISYERIRDEFLKLISSRKLDKLYLICDCEILKIISKDLYDYISKNLDYIKKNLSNLKDKKYIFLLIVLLKDLDKKKIIEILKLFKIDTKSIRLIKNIIEFINIKLAVKDNYYELKKIIFKLGFENLFILLDIQKDIFIDDFIYMKTISKIKSIIKNKIKNECVFLKDMKLNGDDLKKINIKDKNIGFILNKLLDLCHKDNSFNDRCFMLNYVKNNFI
ncbi:MAG: CCA tRNA nucleotidyltransferase [Clostridiales bacterium]|nr:CCA tRNA nucleotidyltransferase [Clostridiales bacterium]